jgi:NTP pyrophosphatase (non-canonical NTP hydrolase)
MNILNTIGEPAVLEQLAEECAELAQAALKLARIERGENPTPVQWIAAQRLLLEEIADVEVCLSVLSTGNVLNLEYVQNVEDLKLKRWKNRLEAAK